jgi:hypothetical protein
MTNHPHRRAARSVLTTETINGIPNAYRDARLSSGIHNLLIPSHGAAVLVRYSWSPLDERMEFSRLIRGELGLRILTRRDGRPIRAIAPPSAAPNWPILCAAVDYLRREWGDLPCQINAHA